MTFEHDTSASKIGIIVPCWDTVRRDDAAFEALIAQASDKAAGRGILILSLAATAALSTLLRDRLPLSYIADKTVLSPARLARLTREIYRFDGERLHAQPAPAPRIHNNDVRFGFIVSNGFGLGHVTRMKAFADGLHNYGTQAFMSFSAGLTHHAHGPVHYLPSAQYLELMAHEDLIYTREATIRFFNETNPTHVFYDGNILAPGMLSALAARPDIHLTWIRRGMWRPDVAARYVAQQAMADLVIEPGDVSDAYDTGPSWAQRHQYCPANAFLKTPPVKPKILDGAQSNRTDSLKAMGLAPDKRYALLMLGACQKSEDATIAVQAVAAVHRIPGLIPVLAHWPISHDAPPAIDGAIVIEKIPLAPFYKGFDVLVSAGGYNSFHEILAAGMPVVFVPQEDPGRDQQLKRAQFASDRGYAQLCRRDSLITLDDSIKAAIAAVPLPPLHTNEWLEDWRPVAAAMAIEGAKSRNSESIQIDTSGLDLSKLSTRVHKAWKRYNKTYKTRFVIALKDTAQPIDKIKKYKDQNVVVVTNSIDPISLRRAGYKYVWVNSGITHSKYGFFRQYLSWLKVFKPESVEIIR